MIQLKYAICFSGFLALASCTSNPGHLEYENTPEAVVSRIQEKSDITSLEEAGDMLEDDVKGVQFVDIRSNYQYAQGHVSGAVNIPVQSLLDASSLSQFSDSTTTFVLYGDTQREATGPWMLLYQMGYENVRVLQGGYTGLSATGAEKLHLPVEDPKYDYAALFEKRVEENSKTLVPPVPKAPPPRKKVIVQPKKKPALPVITEEEEGC